MNELRLLRDKFVALTYFDFGQIDWQNVGFWQQKITKISKFSESVFMSVYFAPVLNYFSIL